ncbi:hypothetical protein ABIB17_003594 [Arthrobacter sp. UYEF6]
MDKQLNAPQIVRRPNRTIDAILFGFFVFDGFAVPGLPVAIPGSDMAAILLVCLAAFRQPRRRIPPAVWLVPLCALLLVYLVLGSTVNDVDWFRRAFRLTVMVVLVGALVSERLDLWAGLKGLGVALAINAILFYANLAPNNYGGLLTGFLGDKNVAALFYCVVPLILIARVKHRFQQAICIFLGTSAVFLTGSRTTLAAYAAALIWMALSRRLGKISRASLILLLVVGLQYLEDNLAQAWIFTNREGSDLLRERIGQASADKADSSPWYGLGLGQGTVVIENRVWFFHDSYLALLVEGGWIMLFAVLGLYLWFGFQPLSSLPRTHETVILEAAMIALLICASKLGEVFLSLPGFILIACVMGNSLGRRKPTQPGAKTSAGRL